MCKFTVQIKASRIYIYINISAQNFLKKTPRLQHILKDNLLLGVFLSLFLSLFLSFFFFPFLHSIVSLGIIIIFSRLFVQTLSDDSRVLRIQHVPSVELNMNQHQGLGRKKANLDSSLSEQRGRQYYDILNGRNQTMIKTTFQRKQT